jgi:hypothetical protein
VEDLDQCHGNDYGQNQRKVEKVKTKRVKSQIKDFFLNLNEC